MTLFIPDAGRISDRDVPVVCPMCKTSSTLDGLTPSEKQALIDLTRYHEALVEYRHCRAIEIIIHKWPATRHPLLLDKLPPNREGVEDESLVDQELARREGLLDYLRSSFRFDKRWPWVRQFETQEIPAIPTARLRCPNCIGQYLIFPEDYFLRIGL